MIGYIIVSVFVIILVLFIYIEYRNQKKYNEEREAKRPNIRKEKKPLGIKPRKVPSAKELEEKKEQEKRVAEQRLEERKKREERARLQEKKRVEEKKKLEEQKLEEKRLKEKQAELESISKPEVTVKIDLPECNYPKFDHSRLIDMGLSAEEAQEFVAELVPQIEAQIPLIEKALEIPDFEAMERLTHSIKGSSTTVGTGGIADLIVDFNTYVKTSSEPTIAEAYFKHLKHYCQELKEQYA